MRMGVIQQLGKQLRRDHDLALALWDRTPHAWAKIEKWNSAKGEFVKRSSYALIASLGVHDKTVPDARFLRTFPWMERAAIDERNFVKKGVSWALRVVGRRNATLNRAATQLSKRLVTSGSPPAVWIGKDALREFEKVKARSSR